MSLWTSKDAEKATGGKATKEWLANGISIDTRTLSKGDLFVALSGDVSDGHKYIKNAFDSGASAAVVSHIPEGMEDKPFLLVADTLKALEDLGRFARHRSGAKIIAITGSVGKSGTKEMLATALSGQGQTHASIKSYNNHWGVPFTLSGMNPGCDYGVFEVGMNHAGEITPLTKMIKPHIAIITAIAEVHIGNFSNGLEGIADAKAEIFSGLGEGGIAILPRDSDFFQRLSASAQSHGAKVISFGENENADARLIDCIEASNGSRIKASILGENIEYTLKISGRHIAMNSIAVLLAVKLSGADIHKAAKEMATIEPLPGRGRREYLTIGDKNNPVTLIDESYNASPIAMRAAFKVLALIDPGRGGRRIAILGDMYEIGDSSEQKHKDLALPLEAAGVQLVYTSGPMMKKLYDTLPENKRGAHHDDSAELAKIVPDVLVPGDVVLVKGSRGGGEKPRMQLVVEALRALPEKMKGKANAV